MGLLATIIKTTVDVVKLPVAIIKDTVTNGGKTIGEDSATIETLKDILNDLI